MNSQLYFILGGLILYIIICLKIAIYSYMNKINVLQLNLKLGSYKLVRWLKGHIKARSGKKTLNPKKAVKAMFYHSKFLQEPFQ